MNLFVSFQVTTQNGSYLRSEIFENWKVPTTEEELRDMEKEIGTLLIGSSKIVVTILNFIPVG